MSVTLHDRINLNDQVKSARLSVGDGSSVASVSGTTANVGLAELEAR